MDLEYNYLVTESGTSVYTISKVPLLSVCICCSVINLGTDQSKPLGLCIQ